MSPAKALRPLGAALVLFGFPLLLSCSSSDPVTPTQDRASDNYLRATITVLDTGSPCTQFSCDPEFYECRGREPIAVGQQWIVHANTVAAGTSSPTSGTQWTVTGTDTTRLTAIALEMALSPPATPPGPATDYRFTYNGSGNSDATFVDIDTECDQVDAGRPESRFYLVRGATDSTLTMTQLSWNGSTSIIAAQPDGQGGFFPESIAEGTFSFIGQLFQSTPAGTFTGEVLVEGCYRVNLPYPKRGVPATASPSAPACN